MNTSEKLDPSKLLGYRLLTVHADRAEDRS